MSALATSESQIMVYMLKGLIETVTQSTMRASIINNVDAVAIFYYAFIHGDANISSTRYTGTDLVGVLEQQPITDTNRAISVTQKLFNQKFNQSFFNSYGFENTFAFIVTKETAKKYNLRSISGLKK